MSILSVFKRVRENDGEKGSETDLMRERDRHIDVQKDIRRQERVKEGKI